MNRETSTKPTNRPTNKPPTIEYIASIVSPIRGSSSLATADGSINEAAQSPDRRRSKNPQCNGRCEEYDRHGNPIAARAEPALHTIHYQVDGPPHDPPDR